MSQFVAAKSHLSIPWYALETCDGLWCVTSAPFDLSDWGINSVIPTGFTSDGMSVPRFFWRWLGPKINKKTVGPSIVHDWLYKTHIVTREEADLWYYKALIHNGYSRIKSSAVYVGLRLCGWTHW